MSHREIENTIEHETKDVCALMECFEKELKHATMDMKSLSHVEAGAVADIIKDLAEAKKNLVECVYKENLIKAMSEAEYGEDYDEDGPMGYRGRSASTGRFVSRGGSGRNAGYRPYPYPYYDGMMSDDYNGRMGYSDRNDGRGGMSQGSDGRGSGYRSSGKGEPYDRHRESRRGYTETHSEDDHKKMKDSISDIFDDMEMIATEVWRDMDQNEKVKYKQKLQAMVQKLQ